MPVDSKPVEFEDVMDMLSESAQDAITSRIHTIEKSWNEQLEASDEHIKQLYSDLADSQGKHQDLALELDEVNSQRLPATIGNLILGAIFGAVVAYLSLLT